MLNSVTTSDVRLERLSNEQLSQVIARCEHAISDGSAQVTDYETFVLAQKELARRTWA
jgi:hypothetical protein